MPPIGDKYLSNGNWKAPIHKKGNNKKVNKNKNKKLGKSMACLRTIEFWAACFYELVVYLEIEKRERGECLRE